VARCREEGYEAAKQCAINHLCTLRGALGSLDKVERIVKCKLLACSTGALVRSRRTR
jgi:hypothetical protein